MNIFQKMSNITTEIKKVAKNLNVNMGRGSYKAVGEADVLEAVKPIEAKHGVYSYPVSRKIVDSGEIVNTYNGNEKKSLYLRIETVYRFVNIAEPKDFVEITTYGDGVDTQDKATGKAMTYADKYALLKAYKIETGDDPDQNPSGELKDKKAYTPANLTDNQLKILNGIPQDWAERIVKKYGKFEDLTVKKASYIIANLKEQGVIQ